MNVRESGVTNVPLPVPIKVINKGILLHHKMTACCTLFLFINEEQLVNQRRMGFLSILIFSYFTRTLGNEEVKLLIYVYKQHENLKLLFLLEKKESLPLR